MFCGKVFEKTKTIKTPSGCPSSTIKKRKSRKGDPANNGQVSFDLVGATGFEPTTPCSQSRCANRTALRPEKCLLFRKTECKDKGLCRNSKGFTGRNSKIGLVGCAKQPHEGVIQAWIPLERHSPNRWHTRAVTAKRRGLTVRFSEQWKRIAGFLASPSLDRVLKRAGIFPLVLCPPLIACVATDR